VRVPTHLAATTTAIALLSACAPPLIAPEDRARICEVAVVRKVESVAFRANPYSDPVGGPLGGAATGALLGVQGGLLGIPLGAAIGLATGAACGAAALAHPDADAKFRKVLEAADTDALRRALQADANAARPECESRTNAAAPGLPDTLVEIDKVEVGMGCAYGKQSLRSSVQWRVLTASDRRLLGETTTNCNLSSSKEFGEWFADPVQARNEVERLLAKTGQWMAAQLRASGGRSECSIDLDAAGSSSATQAQ